MSDASEPGSCIRNTRPRGDDTRRRRCGRTKRARANADRRSIALNPDGSREYWLRPVGSAAEHHPARHARLVDRQLRRPVGEPAGRSRDLGAPAARVRGGPVHAGHGSSAWVGQVRAVGAVLSPMLTPEVFGVPASRAGGPDRAARGLCGLATRSRGCSNHSRTSAHRRCVSALRDGLVARVGRRRRRDSR